MDTIRAFFPKSGEFFQFSKKGRWSLPPLPHSCTPVIYSLCLSVFLYHDDCLNFVNWLLEFFMCSLNYWVFVFLDLWPWPWPPTPIFIWQPRPQICISRSQPSICIYRPCPSICVRLFFVLKLKFVIFTMSVYINSASTYMH